MPNNEDNSNSRAVLTVTSPSHRPQPRRHCRSAGAAMVVARVGSLDLGADHLAIAAHLIAKLEHGLQQRFRTLRVVAIGGELRDALALLSDQAGRRVDVSLCPGEVFG